MSKVCAYRIFYLFVFFLAFALVVSPRVFADDIQAVLDSADGSSNFSVQDSASSEVMHVDSSGNLVTEGCARIDAGGAECSDTEGLIVDGSVGIGVDSASSALHVDSNAADTTAIMTVQNTAGDFQVFTSNGTPEGTVSGSLGDLCVDWQNGDVYVKNSGAGTTAGWESLLSSSASADFGLSQGSVVFGDTDGSLQEDNNNLFWDDANDELGVGTNNPESIVHIKNDVNNSYWQLILENGGIGNNTGSLINFALSGGTSVPTYIGSYWKDSEYDMALGIGAGGTTSTDGHRVATFLYGDTNGVRVGIGTEDPDRQLHVYDTKHVYEILETDSGWISFFVPGDTSLEPAILVKNGDDLRFLTGSMNIGGGGTETMRIKSDGGVEIGGVLTSVGIIDTGIADFGGSTSLEIPNSNASPAAIGQIRLDTVVAGINNGAVAYHDGTNVRYLVDLDTLPTNDDYVVSYDADAEKFYMKEESGGAGIPGGADTQMQYNDAGSFGGIANIIWDDTNLEFADAQHLAFGTDADWLLSYEQTGKEMLTVQTAKTSANNIDDGMMTVAVDTGNAGLTPNQEVFEVGKGASDDEEPNFTELMSVDADGDMTVLGTITAGSGPTQITTISGTLNGEQIADDTVDEDSIDWGTGASQVSCADLPTTDCGAITSTGVVDFGDATSIEIVSDTSPAVNSAGQIALDTNADGTYITQGWLTYYDGTRQMYVPGFDAIGTPSDNDVIAYNDTLHKWVVEAPQGGGGGGIPGGADTQLQYNDGGSFGGIANIIWDDTNLEFADDQRLAFGTAADWLVSYEQSGEDTLSIQTANTASAHIDSGMLTLAVDTGNAGMTPDQEVFEIGRGATDDNSPNFTELFAVDEDGDVTVHGTITAGSGLIQITNPTGTIDGDQIANASIDDDAIDFTDVTSSDLTFDDDTVPTPAVYSGTVSLDDTASGASGASIIGVYDEFDNSNANNVQDVLDDLDAAIVGAGSGDVTGVGDCATGNCLDGSAGRGTYIRLYDGNSNYVEVTPANVTANRTITLPDSDQTVGTATILSGNIVNDTNMVAEDFGDFTCNGNEDGCTLNGDSVDSTEIATNAVGTDEIDLSISPAWTGAHDFGGATSLEIVNSTSPTVNGAGEIAIDTDADGDYIDQGWLTYYDGSQQMYVPAFDAIGTPADNDVIAYDAVADKWVIEAPQGGGGGIPGGADTQLQYNDNGSFGGIANVIWDDTNLEFADAQRLAFGTDADWLLSYEQTGKQMLSIQTAKTSANNIDDGMMTVAVDTGNAGLTANQQVFEVGKGASDDEDANFTELMSVDADGDMVVLGTITAGSGPTQITTSAGKLDGDQIADDTIDEDSVDWGTGASQISCADLPTTDCGVILSTGAIQGASFTDGTASIASGAITGVTSLTFTGADADPDAAGEIQYDNAVAGLTGGGLRWYDDNDSSRLIVDLATDPSNDDYVVAYDAGSGGFYMKEDAGAGAAGDVLSVGDCASGDCLDGSSDGGGYIRLYDGDSNYVQLDSQNIASDITVNMPAQAGNLLVESSTPTWTGAHIFESDVDLTLAGAENLTVGNTTASADVLSLSASIADTQSADAMQITVTDNTSTSGTGRGLVIETGDGSASLDAALAINHTDTTQAMATGLLITGDASTTVTTAIDVSDAEITTALNIGANDIVTSGATISSDELDRLDGIDNDLVDLDDSPNWTQNHRWAKNDPSLLFTPDGNDTNFWLGVNDDNNDTDDDYFQIGDGDIPGTSVFFSIDTNGKVGIGTDSPEELLEVQAAAATDATLTLDANNGDTAADTWKIKSVATANNLSLVNDATEVMSLSSGGNLQIDGDLTVSGDDLFMATNTAGYILVGDDTNFNPVAMSGDCSITAAGVVSCTSTTGVRFNQLDDANGTSTIDFSSYPVTFQGAKTNEDFFTFDFQHRDNSSATDNLAAIKLALDSLSNDAGDVFDGIEINFEDSASNGIIDSGIRINNSETTTSTMVDGIVITSTGVDGGVVDGLDVSNSNITNAINIGDNPIVTGNVAGTIGDSTTDSWTVITDGTGDAEVVLPDDSIGDAEIAFDEVTGADLTLTDSGDIESTGTITFNTEIDNGNSSTADTVDWGAGNKQRSTLTGNCTFTFTAPDGVGSFLLKLIQDGVGSRTVTWPASVKWPSGTAPTLTTDANAIDIVTFYYDGTNYYGSASLDFK